MRKKIFNLIIILSVVIGLSHAVFGFAPNVGTSDYPTILNGDILFSDTTYKLLNKKPQRGDIVSIRFAEGPPRFKRIIGLPTENIKIEDGKVYINGRVLQEDYLNTNQITTELGSFLKGGIDYQIPGDSYFVLGDNRSESRDSRDYGYIGSQMIETTLWGLFRYPLTIKIL